MTKVTVIFVSGTSIVDKVIDAVSHGKYSHVAIKILNGVVEALGVKDQGDKYPGTWIHDASKYDNNPDAIFIDVDLPDIDRAATEASTLIGKPYGYIDCINGGVYDLTGYQLPADKGITENCSETITRILRAGGFNILPDVTADCITPNTLARAMNVA